MQGAIQVLGFTFTDYNRYSSLHTYTTKYKLDANSCIQVFITECGMV